MFEDVPVWIGNVDAGGRVERLTSACRPFFVRWSCRRLFVRWSCRRLFGLAFVAELKRLRQRYASPSALLTDPSDAARASRDGLVDDGALVHLDVDEALDRLLVEVLKTRLVYFEIDLQIRQLRTYLVEAVCNVRLIFRQREVGVVFRCPHSVVRLRDLEDTLDGRSMEFPVDCLLFFAGLLAIMLR